jgi:hypothetical protein
MSPARMKDSFTGEKQINILKAILSKYVKKNKFLHALFITHIGYFPRHCTTTGNERMVVMIISYFIP